jgi:hypothetical protein
MATRNIVPRNTGEGNIGTQLKQWVCGYFWGIYTGSITDGVTTLGITEISKGIGFNEKLNSNFTTTVVTATGTNLAFPIAANEIWVVEVELTTQCSGTGGVKYAIGSPTGAAVEGWILSSLAAITTLSYQRIVAINTLNSTALHTVANTPAPDRIRFVITNGATAGNCVIQVASNTNGQTTTVFAGSCFSARKANSV